MILYLLLPVLILGTVEPKTANITEEELNKVEGNQTFSESNAFNSTNKARNVTSSLNKDEMSQIEYELQSNKTSTNITEDNGTNKARNVTSSLNKDETSQIEYELQSNKTSNITEDNGTNKARNVTSSLNKDEMSQIEYELQSNKTSTNITEDNENFQGQEIEFPVRHCQQHQQVELSYSYCGAIFDQEMQSIGTENWCILEKIIRPYNSLTSCLEKLSTLVGCYYPNTNIQQFFAYIHSFYFYNCSVEEMLYPDAPHGLVMVLTLLPVSLIPVLVYLVVWKSKIQK